MHSKQENVREQYIYIYILHFNDKKNRILETNEENNTIFFLGIKEYHILGTIICQKCINYTKISTDIDT